MNETPRACRRHRAGRARRHDDPDEEYKHEYIEEIEPDLPDMRVDYYRLLQVLTNLVSNAYKYTPDGGKITFRVGKKNGRIEFSVTDTGIGLSQGSRRQTRHEILARGR